MPWTLKKMKTISSIFPVLALAAAFSTGAGAAEIERVGDGSNPRAKVGPDGTIHVVASSRGAVLYYSFDGSSWSGGPIAGTDQVSISKVNQPALGIAPDGSLHVVYGPRSNMPMVDGHQVDGDPTHGVWYTTNTGAGWSAPANIIDLYTEYLSIEADASGLLRLVALVVVEPAYLVSERTWYGGVAEFRREGTAWSSPVSLENAERKYAMLVRDGAGSLHLAVRWKWVHYAVDTGGGWHNLPDTGDTFDAILLPGGSYSMSAPHILVTPDGTVHAVAAAWSDVDSWAQARYAFNDGSGWSEETAGEKDGELVMEGDINLCAVAVEPGGLVHVFCAEGEGGPGSLVHASGRPGSWSAKEVLDPTMADTIDAPAFDSFFHDGKVHVVYQGSDGVYHLTMDPEPPPADEIPEVISEIAEESPPEGVPDLPAETPDPADIADTAGEPDAALDADDGDPGSHDVGGGCTCAI
jgi:hypothetical protein